MDIIFRDPSRKGSDAGYQYAWYGDANALLLDRSCLSVQQCKARPVMPAPDLQKTVWKGLAVQLQNDTWNRLVIPAHGMNTKIFKGKINAGVGAQSLNH